MHASKGKTLKEPVKYVLGRADTDILANELPSNHFDIVSCSYGLKTFNADQLAILSKEVYRILKPGGKFSLVEVSKPKSQLLYLLYSFYLGKVIPVLGKLFLGNPEDYKMLWIYTNRFANAETVMQTFKNNGLNTEFVSYFGGCATGLVGEKSV